MGKREDNRVQRREQIIAAARQLMHAPDSEAFSMRRLAELAGVSIATPYNLFGSKQAVVAAVMDADFNQFQDELKAGEHGPVEVFFEIVRVTAGIFEREPEFYQAGAQALVNEQDALLTTHFGMPRHAMLRDLVTYAIQAGELRHEINPDSLAVALGQQFFGWIQAWATGRLALTEMIARTHYSFSLTLLGASTAASQPVLFERMQQFQAALPEAWQGSADNSSTSTLAVASQP